MWDENRLLLRANEVVDRGGNRDAVEQVQAQADCRHREGFQQLLEAGRCEVCGHYMYNFIMECRRCPLRVCLRCRRDNYSR
jgi:predicted Zn-ribbon and HTH transcriptional regulator